MPAKKSMPTVYNLEIQSVYRVSYGIGSNLCANITVNARKYIATRQAMLGIWAFVDRERFSNYDMRHLDAQCDDAADKAGLQ